MIIVVNHVSHVDPFLIAKIVLDAGRVPRVLAKESIFDVFPVGAAMRTMGHIPVKRGSVDARQSLAAAVDALAAGKVIVLHPEGTVTRDPEGWPMNGKTGAARLAMLAPDVPVIPIAQWGVQEKWDFYSKQRPAVPARRARHVGRSADRPQRLPRDAADAEGAARGHRRHHAAAARRRRRAARAARADRAAVTAGGARPKRLEATDPGDAA